MKTRTRFVVLGLDGLPKELVEHPAVAAVMPHLSALAADARTTTLRALLPELSPVNWTSFATASLPQQHGVFGFTRLHPGGYRLELADSSWWRVPSIFERLSEAGLTSKVLNLPCSGPPKPIKGMHVAGFPMADLAEACYPKPVAALLAAKDYVVETDTTSGATDPAKLLGGLCASLAARRAALDLLWADLDFDLFTFVISETDRLFHFFYPAVTDANHPLHEAVLGVLAEVDRTAGELLARYDELPEPKRLMVLADHGFGPLRTEVDLNAWLIEQGLMRLGRPPQNEWDSGAIGMHTGVIGLDPGRLYLHVKERFARGVFHEHIAERFAGELAPELAKISYEGQPVFEAVHLGMELYGGFLPKGAPDIVCVPKPGFALTAKFDNRPMFGQHGRYGAHRPEGGIFFDSTGAIAEHPAAAGQMVLEAFGLSTQ